MNLNLIYLINEKGIRMERDSYINVADIKDISTGKTIRQLNNEKTHNIY